MAVKYERQIPDPVMKDIWDKSIAQSQRIPLKTRSEFQRLRFALYHCRKVLEALNDPLYDMIKNFSVSSEKLPDGTFQLTVGPADDKLKTYLETLGFGKGKDSDDIDPDLDPTKE